MRSLRKLAVLAVGLGTSVSVFAEWMEARLVSSSGGFLSDYQECTYMINKMFSSIDGEEFTIRIKGSSCPSSVEFDPETNQWRR